MPAERRERAHASTKCQLCSCSSGGRHNMAAERPSQLAYGTAEVQDAAAKLTSRHINERSVLALQLSLTSAAALYTPVCTTGWRHSRTDSLLLRKYVTEYMVYSRKVHCWRSRAVEERRGLLAEGATQDPAQDPRWGVLAGTEQARAGCQLGFASVWDPKAARARRRQMVRRRAAEISRAANHGQSHCVQAGRYAAKQTLVFESSVGLSGVNLKH